MTLRKVLFIAVVVFLFATRLPAANTILVQGPWVFAVHGDSPTSETVSFTLPPLVYGPFTVLADSKDVTGVNVELNGTVIFASESLDAQPLRATVPLTADNTLKVELTGRQGASLTILITGYEYEYTSSYQDLPVATAETLSNDLPAAIDWRTKGAVTPIKNQGQCGSGWAFSATGAVEGIVAIKSGSLHSLSEQQLIDCSGSSGNQGCNGGTPENAFKYIIRSGSASEASYPYTARDGSCKQATSVAHISGLLRLPPGDEETLKARVAQQPVSAVINVTGLQNYTNGVASPNCEGAPPDFQDVLIVGYGESSAPYWIVKNSWGTSWGMSGYLLLKRGINKCGIADFATVPVY
jgi:C1A family cysteine protease